MRHRAVPGTKLGITKDRVTLGRERSSSDRVVLTLPLFPACFGLKVTSLQQKVLKVLNSRIFTVFHVSSGGAHAAMSLVSKWRSYTSYNVVYRLSDRLRHTGSRLGIYWYILGPTWPPWVHSSPADMLRAGRVHQCGAVTIGSWA